MDAFLSFINGFIYTALAFLLCLVFTIGFKWLYLYIKSHLKVKNVNKVQQEQEKPPQKKPKPDFQKPAKKPLRTIEINTDDVDKIYFKKSS